MTDKKKEQMEPPATMIVKMELEDLLNTIEIIDRINEARERRENLPEISKELKEDVETYSCIAHRSLDYMIELAIKARRTNHARIWLLLKHLIGDPDNAEVVRTTLEAIDDIVFKGASTYKTAQMPKDSEFIQKVFELKRNADKAGCSIDLEVPEDANRTLH